MKRLVLMIIPAFICGVMLTNCDSNEESEESDSPNVASMLTFDNWEISKSELGFEINIRGIHFVNAETGFIVGYNGEIYKTNNAGKTWQKQNSGTKSHLQSVFFLDENIGFASSGWGCFDVGCNGCVFLKTTNGGEKWTKEFVDDYWAIQNLHFFDNQNGLAIFFTPQGSLAKPNTKYSYIAKTSNGGDSWDIIDLEIYYSTNKFYCFDNIVYIVGANQKIFKSKDQGNSWETIHTPIETWYSVRNIHFINENIGFIDGISNFYKTVDGGLNWEEVDFPFSSFGTFHFYNETEGFNVIDVWKYEGIGCFPTYKGCITYQTYDGGGTWNESELVYSYYWRLTHFVQRDLGYGINISQFFTIKRLEAGR